MGTKAFVALCDKLAAQYGPRFDPPALLREMAAKGETFYGRFSAKKRRPDGRLPFAPKRGGLRPPLFA